MIILVLLLASAAAWFVSTVAAGGAAMLMIPVVSLLVGPQVVAPAISLGAFIANPSRVWLFWQYIHWPVTSWLISGTLLGALLGAWAFTQISAQWIQIVLGVFLISTIFQYRLGKSERSFPMKQHWFFPLGLVVAFLSGLVGGTGPVHNPFLLNYGLDKEQLVATKAINSLVLQSTKLVTYAGFGAMTMEIGLYGGLIGIGGLAGVWLARNHLANINTDRFRIYTLILMPVCGVLLLIKSVS